MRQPSKSLRCSRAFLKERISWSKHQGTCLSLKAPECAFVPPSPDPMPFIKGRPRYLLRGLIWLFLGLGLLVALSGISRPEAEKSWLLGFIPTGIGLAYLIYDFVEVKRV